MWLRRLVVKAGAAPAKAAGTLVDWAPSDVIKTWQCYALILMFIGTTQSGLLIIGNAAGILATAAKGIPFLVAQSWILVSYGGLVNALGRVGTGLYSDKIGRDNAYTINCLVSALCLFLLPAIIASHNVFLAVHCGGHRLLAVRRRSGPDALLHCRLLRAQEPGDELRHRVPGLGSRLLHDSFGRLH